MSFSQIDTTTDSDSDDAGRRDIEQNLAWLRNTLRPRVKHTDDPELSKQIVEWIKRSHSLPAGDVSDYIEYRLSEMESEYKMYNHDGVDDPEDAFPDGCEGCIHYGGGCPIVTQSVPSDELDRIAAESTTDLTFKREVRSLANLHECHQLPKWITAWETRYEGIVEEGWDLYAEIEVDMDQMDSPGAEPKIDPTDDEEEDN